MLKTRTEQEWVTDYIKGKEHPLPVVLGTKGTWTGNGKPMIILIAFSHEDVLTMGEIYGVAHHPVRVMEEKSVTYYAINIINKKKVKAIIQEWQA